VCDIRGNDKKGQKPVKTLKRIHEREKERRTLKTFVSPAKANSFGEFFHIGPEYKIGTI